MEHNAFRQSCCGVFPVYCNHVPCNGILLLKRFYMLLKAPQILAKFILCIMHKSCHQDLTKHFAQKD